MSELPSIDALGHELERAIARRERSPLPRLRAHAAAVGVIAGLLLAGGAGAAGVLITRGDPITVVPGPGPVPRAATATLDPVRAADPVGGPPWGIRVATAPHGETCQAVGRVLDGRLGVLRGRVFRELPSTHADACVRLGTRTLAPSWSQYPGPNVSARGARTVVHGLAGAGVVEVIVTGPSGTRRLAPSRRGVFLTVYEGLLDARDLPVVASRPPGDGGER